MSNYLAGLIKNKERIASKLRKPVLIEDGDKTIVAKSVAEAAGLLRVSNCTIKNIIKRGGISRCGKKLSFLKKP